MREGPRPAELHGALSTAFGWPRDQTLPDVLAPQLEVLLVGINPGVYSAAIGHHFGRPGNRFWKTLAGAGFTPRVLDPREDGELPRYGLGVTNLVVRTTARADELSQAELREGAGALEAKVARLTPAVVAILGITAYRAAFARPRAALGRQPELLAGAHVWVLPNPSGLNAHHQLPDLIALFAELRAFVRGLRPCEAHVAPAPGGGSMLAAASPVSQLPQPIAPAVGAARRGAAGELARVSRSKRRARRP